MHFDPLDTLVGEPAPLRAYPVVPAACLVHSAGASLLGGGPRALAVLAPHGERPARPAPGGGELHQSMVRILARPTAVAVC